MFFIRDVCELHKNRVSDKPPPIKNIIWSIAPQHNLIMCRTAKHGSTTWANIFVQILSKKYSTLHQNATIWFNLTWKKTSFKHQLPQALIKYQEAHQQLRNYTWTCKLGYRLPGKILQRYHISQYLIIKIVAFFAPHCVEIKCKTSVFN